MVGEQGTLRGREKAGEGAISYLSFPIACALQIFVSQLPPQPLCDTNMPLGRGETVPVTGKVYSPCLMSEAIAKKEQNTN